MGRQLVIEQYVTADPAHVFAAWTSAHGGTRVVLEHDLPDIAGDGEDIRQGWQDVLARLAAVCGAA